MAVQRLWISGVERRSGSIEANGRCRSSLCILKVGNYTGESMKELKNHPQYQKRTRSQQLEARMLSITKKRAEDKRSKAQVSNTTAGVALREELVDLVKQELEAALKPYDEQGKGNKPRWYKPLRAVDTRLTANLAVNCFIDAAGNGWKLTKAREQTGKAFVALMLSLIHI